MGFPRGTRHEKNTTNERDAWAQGLRRCGECCKQRDCMAVGTVASTATAWLLARLQAQRVHGCWQGCKHSDCIVVGIIHYLFARGRTPTAGVCFLPAVTSGLAARSTKCHRLAATMHGIDELVAPTTPTYVSCLYVSHNRKEPYHVLFGPGMKSCRSNKRFLLLSPH